MKLLKNVYIAQGIVAFTQIIIVVISSHKLNIYELGLYSIAQVINSIACFAIPSGMARSIQAKSDGTMHQKRDLLAIFSLTPFLAIGFIFTLMLSLFWQERFKSNIPISFVLLLYLISILNIINQYLISFFRVYKSLASASLIEVSLAIIQACSVIFLVFLNPTVNSLLLANVISHGLVSIIISLSAIYSSRTCESPKKEQLISRIKILVGFSLRVNSISIASYFINQLPILFFGARSNFEYAAEYGRAVLIATVTLTILFTSFSRIHYINIAKLTRKEISRYVDAVILPSILIVNLLFFIISINSDLIVWIFMGDKWKLAPLVLSIAALGASLQYANSIYIMSLEVKGQFHIILANLIVMGGVTLVVMFLGSRNEILLNYTYLLTAISSSVFCVFHLTLTKSFFKFIPNKVKLLYIVLEYLVLSFAVFIFSDTFVIKGALIIFMIAIVYQIRRDLFLFLKGMKRTEGYLYE